MTGGQMGTINIELFGKDPRMVKTLAMAKNISVTKSSVLITGEAGVGKRSLAQYIHENSNRAQRPLEVVDCAGSPKDVENRILGFREESTGRFKKGAIELGNGGTVIFAHVDALAEEMQKKLYRILNELKDYDIDLRMIATTTKNMAKLVNSGRFYRGLYLQLSNNTIFIPALRDRPDDLKQIIEHYLRQAAQEASLEVNLTPAAWNGIMEHYWPNNLQEIIDVVAQTVQEANGQPITEISLGSKEVKSDPLPQEDTGDGMRLMSLKEAEKLLIKKALLHTSENRTQAAKILGVSIRTLRNKINEYREDGSAFFINLR